MMPNDPDQSLSMEDPRENPERRRHEEEQWAKVLRVKQYTLGLVVLLVVLVIAAGIIFFVRLGGTTEAIRNTQTEGSPTQKRLIDIAEQIQSCTTEGGECNKRQQEETAKAVAKIIVGNSSATRVIISAALSCQADGISEKQALLDCTVARSR